jgi:hypothetical protein
LRFAALINMNLWAGGGVRERRRCLIKTVGIYSISIFRDELSSKNERDFQIKPLEKIEDSTIHAQKHGEPYARIQTRNV